MSESKNFFQRMPVRFEEVPVDEQGNIPTAPFIEASKALVLIFGIKKIKPFDLLIFFFFSFLFCSGSLEKKFFTFGKFSFSFSFSFLLKISFCELGWVSWN